MPLRIALALPSVPSMRFARTVPRPGRRITGPARLRTGWPGGCVTSPSAWTGCRYPSGGRPVYGIAAIVVARCRPTSIHRWIRVLSAPAAMHS
jgi:hypothetical protein